MPILDWTVIFTEKPRAKVAWTHSLADGAVLLVTERFGGTYAWELSARGVDMSGRAVTLEDAQRQAELAADAARLVDLEAVYAKQEREAIIAADTMDRAQVAALIDIAMRGGE